MKTPTPFLLLAIFYCCQCFSQTSSYIQSNREVEYNYGIIADDDLPKISEIEKIKYEFRYLERTVVRTIDQAYHTVLDITIDSNGYEQSWMNLAKRFHYDEKGIACYDKQNKLVNTLSYTERQKSDNAEISTGIKESGFHPGLAAFPYFNKETSADLQSQGVLVETNEDRSLTTLIFPGGEKETYDNQNLSIIRTWYNKDGLKNIETTGYEPYLENRGYLQRIRKRETFLQSVNGPCIIDVKLVYYSDYKIKDGLHLIDKATQQIENIKVYPNPNDGIFNVSVELPRDGAILGTRISNILTGEEFWINKTNEKAFVTDIRNYPAGHYVIQVITNQSSLSAHFFKQ
jgi:hypothetical protein